MFKVPEQNRVIKGYMATAPNVGNFGHFEFNPSPNRCITCIAMGEDDTHGWEHVSVSVVHKGQQRMPTWNEMCMVKDQFWDEEDVVMQFHPKKSEYVNNHEYCLHLWRKNGENAETPPSILLGYV